MRDWTWALASLLALSLACKKAPAPESVSSASPVDEGRTLFEQGQLASALTKLQQAPGNPESLYLQGRVWAKQAETAPVPAPPPAPSPLPRGFKPPPAPEFKPEELRAISALEQAIAIKPDHVAAHLALAQILEPHATLAYDQAQMAAKAKRPLPSVANADAGPDFGSARVAREYQASAQGTPPSRDNLEACIRFGVRVKELRCAEWAFEQMVAINHMDPQPLVRFGDFLLNEKKDVAGAVDRYQQILILKPDDDASRDKIADIYIDMGAELFGKRQYSVAEVKLKEAQKYITDRQAPRARKLQQLMARLDEIRGH